MTDFEPAYHKLTIKQMGQRTREAFDHLTQCDVCAWECGVDRTAGKKGVCMTSLLARVNSYSPHHGEEKPLRGWRGSGTIFFNRCNLRCQYCQNYEISQTDKGHEITNQELANIMLDLQKIGCHNINFVSPSHVVPQIIAAVAIAAQSGLYLPLVYNTGGYDSLVMLQALDGIIDIYMPDMKYSNQQVALHYSKIRNYPKINQVALIEMHRQVGDLYINSQGIASRGVLVRHLVLPNGIAGTKQIVRFLTENISPNTYLNIMDQYQPAYNAHIYPHLNRKINNHEYQEAVEMALQAGLHRLDSLMA